MSYVLTDLERERIQQFIEDKTETKPIKILRTRARKWLPRLTEDIKLLNEVLKKGISLKS